MCSLDAAGTQRGNFDGDLDHSVRSQCTMSAAVPWPRYVQHVGGAQGQLPQANLRPFVLQEWQILVPYLRRCMPASGGGHPSDAQASLTLLPCINLRFCKQLW